MNKHRFETIMRLPAPKRYDHFIKSVADSELVWSLWEGGWAGVGNADNIEGMPIWPEREFAESYRDRVFSGWEVRSINLHWLLDVMLQNIREEGEVFVIFPTDEGSIWPDIDRLEADLRQELSRYE